MSYSFHTPYEAFQASLAHEKHITQKIKEMNAKIIPFDKDFPQLDIAKLCEWFEHEQQEEEESVSNVLKMIEEAEKIGKPMNALDLEIYFLKADD